MTQTFASRVSEMLMEEFERWVANLPEELSESDLATINSYGEELRDLLTKSSDLSGEQKQNLGGRWASLLQGLDDDYEFAYLGEVKEGTYLHSFEQYFFTHFLHAANHMLQSKDHPFYKSLQEWYSNKFTATKMN